MTQNTTTTESYTYDPVGNRLSSLGVSSYTNNSSNELTSTPSTTYTYDNDGNMATEVTSAGTTQYFWDFENRLTSVTLPGSGGTVSYKYDPFGRRVYKSTSTATSVYAYDGDNLVEETNATGTAVARYSQGLNIDEPLAMLRSSATSYYHADGLGSITSLSNAAGTIANTYTYDSFGKLTASTGSLVNPFQYTARESDSETGLYYYRARYYDPAIGGFLSEDPMEFYAGSMNYYSYSFGNPLNLMDPSGLEPTWWQKIVNWVFGPSNTPPTNEKANCPLPKCGPDGYRDPTPAEGAGILAAAKGYEGTPYKWGGNDGNGLDCSGLVMCAIRGSVSPNFPIDPRLNTGGLNSKNPGFRQLNPGEPLYPGDILLFPGHMGLYDPDPSGWDTYSARGTKTRPTPGVTRGKQKMFGTIQGTFRVKIPCPH